MSTSTRLEDQRSLSSEASEHFAVLDRETMSVGSRNSTRRRRRSKKRPEEQLGDINQDVEDLCDTLENHHRSKSNLALNSNTSSRSNTLDRKFIEMMKGSSSRKSSPSTVDPKVLKDFEGVGKKTMKVKGTSKSPSSRFSNGVRESKIEPTDKNMSASVSDADTLESKLRLETSRSLEEGDKSSETTLQSRFSRSTFGNSIRRRFVGLKSSRLQPNESTENVKDPEDTSSQEQVISRPNSSNSGVTSQIKQHVLNLFSNKKKGSRSVSNEDGSEKSEQNTLNDREPSSGSKQTKADKSHNNNLYDVNTPRLKKEEDNQHYFHKVTTVNETYDNKQNSMPPDRGQEQNEYQSPISVVTEAIPEEYIMHAKSQNEGKDGEEDEGTLKANVTAPTNNSDIANIYDSYTYANDAPQEVADKNKPLVVETYDNQPVFSQIPNEDQFDIPPITANDANGVYKSYGGESDRESNSVPVKIRDEKLINDYSSPQGIIDDMMSKSGSSLMTRDEPVKNKPPVIETHPSTNIPVVNSSMEKDAHSSSGTLVETTANNKEYTSPIEFITSGIEKLEKKIKLENKLKTKGKSSSIETNGNGVYTSSGQNDFNGRSSFEEQGNRNSRPTAISHRRSESTSPLRLKRSPSQVSIYENVSSNDVKQANRLLDSVMNQQAVYQRPTSPSYSVRSNRETTIMYPQWNYNV